LKSPFKEVDWLGNPENLQKKYPDLTRNVFVWQKQSGLELFNQVGYAEHEKDRCWDLPGKGNSYSDCGKVKAKGCDNVHGHPDGKVLRRLYKHNCRRKACPICFEGWAVSEAERALIRLASYVVGNSMVKELISDLKKGFATKPKRVFHEALVVRLENRIKEGRKDRSRGLKPIHVVLSPPQGIDWHRRGVYEARRKKAYEVAKKVGLHGSSLIHHPYRLRCQICKATIPDYVKQCVKCGSFEFEWFFSPHFHCVGFGWISGEKVAEGYAKESWVVKNLGIRKSVYWTFQYLLSHAGVSKFHTVTWFGSLAYNKLRYVPILGSVRELCPECGSPLRPMKWCLVDRPPPELIYSRDPYKNDSWEDPSEWRCF
jgi:hypothetical protein